MKILHTVEFYHPSKGGAQEVVKQLSERLVDLGHDVTVATTKINERKKSVVNGVKLVDFEISGNFGKGIKGSNTELERYKKLVTSDDFDIVMTYAAQQWTVDVFLQVMDKVKAKKVFVPCGFSGLYEGTYKEYFQKMPVWLERYDRCVYLSEDYRDINFARDRGIKNDEVIPNGAGKNEFGQPPKLDIRQKLGIKPDDFMILTVGSHTGMKGHSEAVEILYNANISNAVLVINANSFGGGCTDQCRRAESHSRFNPKRWLHSKKIVNVDLPRNELIAAYFASDLFLFPSNLECSPLVLFEAVASGTPFLASEVGNSKEIVIWTGGGMLIPTELDQRGFGKVDIQAGSKLLTDLYKDKKTRIRLGKQGRQKWLKRFTWEKICRDYEKLYKQVLAS